MSLNIRNPIISSELFGDYLHELYAPATVQQKNQEYILTFMSHHYIDSYTVDLLNSKTGAVHSISNPFLSSEDGEGEMIYNGHFELTSESTEADFIDFIVFTFKISFEGGVETDSLRLKISIKPIKEEFETFKYTRGSVKIVDSNLISPRVKVGFAKWSTPFKNDISNVSKLLEPLHSVFSSSFTKTNELLKQTYDLSYTPYTFSRIFLHGYPLNIFREVQDGFEELKETDDINSSIKKVEVDEFNVNTDLIRVFFNEDTLENKSKIYDLNDYLPTTLYLKKIANNERLLCNCVVKGFDKFNNSITETLTLRSDLYTQLQNNFSKITKLHYDDNAIEVATYVDLRYNHYIISRPYITPPIVDSNLVAFKPHPVIKSNQENTGNTLIINNGLNVSGTEQYRFSFGEEGKITSLYINEELDVIYIKSLNGESELNYSKLKIDYSKNTLNDVTLNNNKFISVSDNRTSIGDWVDVTVKLTEWFKYKDQKSLTLRVVNGDSTLYYNQNTGNISTEKSYVYSELADIDILEFSIGVENSSPYIFSIISEDGEVVSAMTCIETIDSYYSEVIDDTHLIHYNNSVYHVGEDEGNFEDAMIDPDPLNTTIIIKWENYPVLNYKLEFTDGYYISDSESNLNNDFYKINLPENEGNNLVVITLNNQGLKRLFNTEELSFKLGTAFDINNGVLDGREFANITVILPNNEYSAYADITPEHQYGPVHVMEKVITVYDTEVIIDEVASED